MKKFTILVMMILLTSLQIYTAEPKKININGVDGYFIDEAFAKELLKANNNYIETQKLLELEMKKTAELEMQKSIYELQIQNYKELLKMKEVSFKEFQKLKLQNSILSITNAIGWGLSISMIGGISVYCAINFYQK